MGLVVVVMGVSGTGKSTVARRLAEVRGWPMAEGDDFHPAANVAKMRAGTPLTDADRWPWLATLAAWIGEQPGDAVLTCSALRRAYRDRLCAGHPSVRFLALVAPHSVLAERMRSRRGHFMPASLLDSQLATLEPLQPDEPGAAVDVTGAPREIEGRVAAIVDGWLAEAAASRDSS